MVIFSSALQDSHVLGLGLTFGRTDVGVFLLNSYIKRIKSDILMGF